MFVKKNHYLYACLLYKAGLITTEQLELLKPKKRIR